MNLPTKVTVSRMFAVPLIAVAFYVEFPFHRLVASIIFVLAACTDMIDGNLARKRGEVTDIGKILDPIADKVIVAFSLVFIVAEGDVLLFAPYGAIFTAMILTREILIGAFRTIAAGRGVVLAADKWGKLKTIALNTAIPVLIIARFSLGAQNAFLRIHSQNWINNFELGLKISGNVLFYLATFLAVFSGINYVLKGTRLIKDQNKDEEK